MLHATPSHRNKRAGISRGAGRSSVPVAEGAADTTVNADESELSVSPSTVLSNGTATSTVTVVLRNAAGTTLSGKTVTLAATGDDNVLVQPDPTDGDGVATGTIASTTAEVKTVSAISESITLTDTGEVTFSTAPALDFYSKFATLGTDDTARSDSNKWNEFDGNTPGLEVIEATGLDFPTDNVLVVTEHVTPALDKVLRKTGLAIPDVGSSRFYRYYLRVSSAAAVAVTDSETHPMQDGPSAGQINHGWWIYHATGGAGKWTPQINVSPLPAQAYPNYLWRPTSPLDYDTTYRFERRIERTGTTTFKLTERVYNSAGDLVRQSSDYRDANSATTLAAYMATNDFSFFNVANLGGWNAGSNGLGGAEGAPGIIYSYQGGFATGIDCGWIGPFDGSNEA